MHIVYEKKSDRVIVEKLPVTYIMICCCTYKRPDKLERLLNNLCNINYPDIKTEILIIDNDKEQCAKKVSEKFKNILPLHYVNEEQKGFSNVRNRAIKESLHFGASHIAFIDDDEIADNNWLINHVDFYEKFKEVYISSGPTYKKFENDYPDYIINNTVFSSSSSKQLGDFKETCASGNVFCPLNIIKESNIYFSEDFNFSGSEDTDFFSRLKNAGYNIGWNYNAVNFELVNDERANVRWILKRAFNNGYSVALVKFSKSKRFIKRLVYICGKIITLFVDFTVIILSLPFGVTKSLNAITRFVKNFGKLASVIRLRVNKYC